MKQFTTPGGILGLLTAGLLAGSAMGQTITNGLVGYWPMDNSQGTEVTDYTSTTNHGAFTAGTPGWAAGKLGNALAIDSGSPDNIVTIPHHASYNASNAYSISLWFWTEASYRIYDNFRKGNVQFSGENGASIIFDKFGDAPWTTTGLFSNNGKTWHLITIVFDPSTNWAKKVYVDATLVASNTAAAGASDTALNTSPIIFSADGNYLCRTRYDDVAIWNRALTSSDITYLYNGGTGRVVTDALNTPPVSPTNVMTYAGDTLVILSWDANTVDLDVSTYSVFQSTSPGGPYTRVASNLTVTTVAATNLVNDTPYYFEVRTVDVGGAESTDAVAVSATPVDDVTAPAVPAGLSAAGGYDRVVLSWSANTEPDLAGYNIYQASSAGGPFVLTQVLVAASAAVPPATAAFPDVPNGVAAYFYVTAEDLSDNESAPSSIVSATPRAFHDTNRGLVGYWPMDNTNGTELTDHTDTANHGAFTVGTPTWVTGKFGNALRLYSSDGDDHAAIPHHADYVGTGVFSISFWFKPKKVSRTGDAFTKGSVKLLYRNSETQPSVQFGSDWAQNDTALPRDDQWHHIVYVFDPFSTDGKAFYWDGVLDLSRNADSGIADSALNTSDIILRGAGAPDPSYYADRSFDDVAIWAVALTLDQVRSLYLEGEGRVVYTPPPAGTVLVIR